PDADHPERPRRVRARADPGQDGRGPQARASPWRAVRAATEAFSPPEAGGACQARGRRNADGRGADLRGGRYHNRQAAGVRFPSTGICEEQHEAKNLMSLPAQFLALRAGGFEGFEGAWGSCILKKGPPTRVSQGRCTTRGSKLDEYQPYEVHVLFFLHYR